MIEAHVCSGGKFPGIIRPYCALCCSLCCDGVDLVLPKEAIEEHNESVRNPPEKPLVIHGPTLM